MAVAGGSSRKTKAKLLEEITNGEKFKIKMFSRCHRWILLTMIVCECRCVCARCSCCVRSVLCNFFLLPFPSSSLFSLFKEKQSSNDRFSSADCHCTFVLLPISYCVLNANEYVSEWARARIRDSFIFLIFFASLFSCALVLFARLLSSLFSHLQFLATRSHKVERTKTEKSEVAKAAIRKCL